MFNSPVLDLVILLSFTYFIGSLVLSTINELIVNQLWGLRKKNLKDALEGLITADTSWTKYVRDNVIKNPHIQSLMEKEGSYPSCIPSANFISALVTEIRKGGIYDQANLKESITKSGLPSKMKDILYDYADQAAGDLKEFEAKIESFYTNAMDRATGWYKRKLKWWLLGLGFIISVALNIDTIKICRDSFADKGKLSETASAIAKEVQNIKRVEQGGKVIYTIKKSENDTTGTSITVSSNTEIINSLDKSSAISDSTQKTPDVKQTNQNVERLTVIYQQATGNPFGYSGWDDFISQWAFNNGIFFLKFLGIVITAFALQLGADYWFGLLTKTVNIRSAGKNSDEKK